MRDHPLTPPVKATTRALAHCPDVFSVFFFFSRTTRRSLEHSTILYESQDLSPLLRVAWNMQDSNYLATILTASPHTVILDVRCASRVALSMLPQADLQAICSCAGFGRADACAQSACRPGREVRVSPGVGQWHRLGAAFVFPHLHVVSTRVLQVERV